MSLSWFMDVSSFLLISAVVDMMFSLLADFIHPAARIERAAARICNTAGHSFDQSQNVNDSNSCNTYFLGSYNEGISDGWKTEWNV